MRTATRMYVRVFVGRTPKNCGWATNISTCMMNTHYTHHHHLCFSCTHACCEAHNPLDVTQYDNKHDEIDATSDDDSRHSRCSAREQNCVALFASFTPKIAKINIVSSRNYCVSNRNCTFLPENCISLVAHTKLFDDRTVYAIFFYIFCLARKGLQPSHFDSLFPSPLCVTLAYFLLCIVKT